MIFSNTSTSAQIQKALDTQNKTLKTLETSIADSRSKLEASIATGGSGQTELDAVTVGEMKFKAIRDIVTQLENELVECQLREEQARYDASVSAWKKSSLKKADRVLSVMMDSLKLMNQILSNYAEARALVIEITAYCPFKGFHPSGIPDEALQVITAMTVSDAASRGFTPERAASQIDITISSLKRQINK